MNISRKFADNTHKGSDFMPRYITRGVFLFDTPPKIESFAAVAGEKEGQGPLGDFFDKVVTDSHFGQKTWEQAESKFQLEAVSIAVRKANLTKEDIDMSETLGGKFVDASEKLCRELDIRGGVQVAGIKAEGLLARARVKEGFVITHINDRAVYSLSDLKKLTGKIRSIDGIYPNGRAASYVVVE